MSAASSRWYQICERLGQTTSTRTYAYAALPLTVRLRADIDMADATGSPFAMASPLTGQKRGRDDDGVEDEGFARGLRFEKKARPTSGESTGWQRDSVISTPRSLQQTKYDSDDQSSMVSEPGSPQDIDMSSDDEEMMQDSDSMPAFSQSPEARFAASSQGRPPFESSSSPWHASRHLQNQNRVPTPSILHQRRPDIRPIQLRTGLSNFQSQHTRGRHPQENIPSDGAGSHLEVPSPIDEDEVPTPPSAAEAAGSQLSMLSVNDMDIEPAPDSGLPTISVDDLEETAVQSPANMDSAIDVDAMDETAPNLTVRKPRQRSGAVSSGHGGSPSPVRGDLMGMAAKRGFSMGFRGDCEKCRMRVPGHMNHFIAS